MHVDVLDWLGVYGCLQISQLKVLVNQVLDVAKATVEAASALLATQDITAAASTQASMEVSHY